MPPVSTGFAQASACESSNILQHCARNTQRAFRGRPQTIGKRRNTLQHQVPGGRELGGRRAKDHLSLCKLSGVKLCTLFGVFFEYGRTGGAYGRGPKTRPLWIP